MKLVILFVIGIIIVLFFVSFFRRNKVNPVALNGKSISQKKVSAETKDKGVESSEQDYYHWVSILQKDNPNIEEFELFGTKAAILWSDGAEEVEIVCLTGFSKGKPDTKKYEYFSYNVKEWYWSGIQPRGCASKVKEQLKSIESKIT